MPSCGEVLIRQENNADARERSAVRAINEAAFGGWEEADLVDRLRAEGYVLASLVAEVALRPVGHIRFSRMSIETEDGAIPAAALAPVAVLPDHQRRGIGERLIRYGLELLRTQGEQIVLVVGHPEYYPRFGFSSSQAINIQSPFPPEAFMAMELKSGALEGIRGRVRYPPPFGI